MTATATTADIATAIGTDPRTLRKFLRATTDKTDQPGKGSRYTLPADKRSIAALAKKFSKWDEARKADKADDAPNTPDAPEADNEVEATE